MFVKCSIKRLLKFKVQFILISLIMLLYTSTVFADSNYTVFTAKQNISTDKVWNIKFSKDIDKNTVNSENIRVVDENGDSLKLDLSSSGNNISIKPSSTYDPGKTYTIYVDNIKALNGSALKKPRTMKFTTKNDVQAIDASSYSLVDTHTYKVTDILTFTADKDTKLDIAYNLGTLSNSPYQKELDLKVTGENAQVTSTNSVNQKLTASSSLKPGEKLQYQVTRTIQVSGIKYTKDLSKTSGDYGNFSEYSKYTTATDKIESNNSAIIDKSKELFIGITNPYYKSKKAYEFVNSYMIYDESNKNKGALNALQTSRGVCEDYSELFVALLRASGVPARVATGYWVDSKNFYNNTATGNDYRHAWAEYYLPEYGWIVVEPTNIYYYNGKQTIDYSHFSNLNGSTHFISGYDAAGENKDGNIYYNYLEGSGVTTHLETKIEKLN
ncbi:transglutaminase domain-containing protein [Clostridium magnum]|uniref:Protein-glutamine gamma-glutamyltransferase n=1 Tax=Clostridium magnum DSM 2767 TaxID=1121326 RepID=A0A162S0F0_9CLOT|nr:transglutaminase domain-containing protein [Clostridium magnum]KZL90620.1 protein-glutamine gamma-glutamyltransferase [Clostridium magnum DSM 2767]SHI05984.1 Ig-like domain-containing protein [Clostridium magnum DSM 2767]